MAGCFFGDCDVFGEEIGRIFYSKTVCDKSNVACDEVGSATKLQVSGVEYVVECMQIDQTVSLECMLPNLSRPWCSNLSNHSRT